jgi:hypothetical protein
VTPKRPERAQGTAVKLSLTAFCGLRDFGSDLARFNAPVSSIDSGAYRRQEGHLQLEKTLHDSHRS